MTAQEARAIPPATENTAGQAPILFASAGTRLIAAANCRVSDYENPQQEVWEVDPATGKPRWKYQLARG
ncbi:hypothetical protein HGA06_20200, partial [Streptomyces somaliensis DSM 40738]|nr:hypothetical protein [Streptomyces somaliensis DSM 40738]